MQDPPTQEHGASHRRWFAARARIGGGEIRERPAGSIAAIPGEQIQVWSDTPEGSAELADEVTALARDLGVREVGWWAGDGSTTQVTGARLLARGFRWGWQPHWMTLDAERLVDHPPPDGVVIESLEESVHWEGEAHSLYDPVLGLPVREMARHGIVWFAAYVGNEPVGTAAVHLAPDESSAGLYACAVLPARRRRGIGAALTVASCRRAVEQGHRRVVLNATPLGRPMYARCGFVSVGDGQTWWLLPPNVTAPPVDRTAIAAVEAIGAGDLEAITTTVESGHLDVDATLRCGLTPIEVGVLLERPDAVRRLVEKGAVLDVLSAWDLGWRSEAAESLAAHPELLDRRSGDLDATPLHIAVERGDRALAELLLAAGADVSARDGSFGATPLGWAEHLGRTEMIRLLRSGT